jgi:hypothetical protein
MNGLSLLNSFSLYLEIGPDTLYALADEQGVELPLERQANGRLTAVGKEKLAVGLQSFLKRKSWQPRTRALCAIGARGVSLRRLTLPAAAKDELQRLLLLQIESEFPLPPDQLAWGWQPVGEHRPNGAAKQDLLVAAVKKDVVDDYSEVLLRCGINPVFTLAALARSRLAPRPTESYALLDIGAQSSEFILFDNGVPTSIRVLSWGEQNQSSANEALDGLAKSLNGAATGRRLFLSGRAEAVKELVAQRVGAGVICETLPVPAGPGRSAAIVGLKKSVEAEGPDLLLLQSRQTGGRNGLSQPTPRKWAMAAAALLLGALLLPYAEAILMKPVVVHKLTAMNAGTNRLDKLDREMDFLQTLKQSQPPYLDALYLFAKCAPQGSRIDSLNMNRRGEVSMRGSMRNADQVTEFRSKLIASGFFYSVSVEDQTPTPDRQKVNLRIIALWKPIHELKQLAIGPTADEIEKAKTRKDQPGGAPGGMPMGMPMGMPAGVSFGGMPPGAMPSGLPPGIVLPDGAPPGAARPRTRPPGGPVNMSTGDLPPGVELPPGAVPRTMPPRMEGNQ